MKIANDRNFRSKNSQNTRVKFMITDWWEQNKTHDSPYVQDFDTALTDSADSGESIPIHFKRDFQVPWSLEILSVLLVPPTQWGAYLILRHLTISLVATQ